MAVTKYLYDGDTILQEYDGLGATLTEYTSTGRGYGDLLSAYDGSAAKYYEPDALGSTDALADQSQTVVDRWKYRAFGSATQTAGTDSTPFTWVGRQGYYSDSETGLYQFGNGTRYYDPGVAQFLSADPIGFAGGDANVRRYGSNNPVSLIDPSGLADFKLEYTNAKDYNVKLGNCGAFSWRVMWKITPGTAVGGQIIQKVTTGYMIEDCCNTKVNLPLSVAEYWEAFEIVKKGPGFDGTGTTAVGFDDNFWFIDETGDETQAEKDQRGDATKGEYTVSGEAIFYDGLALPAAFKPSSVKPAGALPATTKDPGINQNKGTSNLVKRSITVEWNCCPGSKSRKTTIKKITR